ncbi:hypothetical protein GCM10010401_01940 [Rarobacter faecitabidus]|uniref:N-acetylmuramoyl-L-alanine amidase n=1 Tax=Rarobacter faecitabidus TaxID=13243 RepID=A0A542ZWD9_RARFA|nr:N-acetylmuramoyl-L-alanine amidase [Rarobacter faecitabidus]TQL64671.1 N-acetylmuramoyl-L-alanine amidase [Rarobacter faecitabidus]
MRFRHAFALALVAGSLWTSAPGTLAAPNLPGAAVVSDPGVMRATGTVAANVSLTSSSRNAAPGTTIRLTGRVRNAAKGGVADARVVIQKRRIGAANWHTYRTVRADSSGRYRTSTNQKRGLEYRASVKTGKRTVRSSTRAVTATSGDLPLAGVIVALDPGHNGKNAAAQRAAAPDGRGSRKTCNTSGTGGAGISEHRFNWLVAKRTRTILRKGGATVILTRNSDTGNGPCVDVRGRFAGDHDADLLVSIHANGSVNTSVRGFFAIVTRTPLNKAQGKPSRALAKQLIGSLEDQGFAKSSTIRSATSYRNDLGTLNWSAKPVVMLELGEMRNARDVAVMRSAKGQRRYARAIAAGISAWVAAS